MDNNELIVELLQSLTEEIKGLGKKMDKLPTQAPPDYKISIDGLTRAVEQLQHTVQNPPTQAKQAPPVVDLTPILKRLDNIEHYSRHDPNRKMSQYVQVGAFASGLMVVLTVISVWCAITWRTERDDYAQAYTYDNWRVRYTKQVNPEYYNYMEGVYAKNPSLFMKWTAEQEQADQKRELAREAAQQAKALSDQANQLEGKSMTKGKKKERL